MDTSRVDAAFEEGWAANEQDLDLSSNPYSAASPADRLLEMQFEAWRLGWLRADLAREAACAHMLVLRQRALFGRLDWP